MVTKRTHFLQAIFSDSNLPFIGMTLTFLGKDAKWKNCRVTQVFPNRKAVMVVEV